MKPIQAYKCDFCHRCFTRVSNAQQHEDHCKNNPVMRACKTCKYGTWKVTEAHGDYEIFGAYCDKYDAPIHEKPYFIECDIKSYCDMYEEEIPIPYTCQNYEYKGNAEWTKEEVEERR